MKTKITPVVYTSLDGLKLPNVDVRSIDCLARNQAEWITETAIEHMENMKPPKLKAREELQGLFSDIEEQVYFRIGLNAYFVDFFMPKYNMAVDIEGRYHSRRERETDFRSIGIRSIRISADRVMDGFLKEDLFDIMKKEH